MYNPAETVFVLSATYHSGDGDGNMYFRGTSGPEGNTVDDIANGLWDAMVFENETDAWYYREHQMHSTGWQITPFPRKRIFETRLKGK